MEAYQKSIEVMNQVYGKDSILALATVKDNIPSVRYVDVYYENEAFYIVVGGRTQKVEEIEGNPHVALCHMGHRFNGLAKNIGHPLDENNKEIRKTLMKVFEPWYLPHNNEEEKTMCYIKVELTDGFLDADGTGYKIDFKNNTAESFPFDMG